MITTHQIEKVQMDIPQITYNLHQGQEIQFLYYNQADKKFQLNQDVIDLLLQHGEANIGKTFLFNHALDLDSRYNSFKPQVPGARMWTEPFYKKEDNLIIFFVDIEGFGTDENFSNFIWILAFMLSSCIIYSSQGKISEQSMVNLRHLNYLADNLQFAQGRMENEYSMAYYSPKFLWLMKDYKIDEYDDNNYQLEPDQFLEQKLTEEYSNQDALLIRDLFMNIFKDRSALDFEQPPYHQYNFEQLSLNLSPYFKDQVDFLKEKIYSNSKLKLYDGIIFSCGMLVNFISCMIQLYNENEIINYQEILSAVLERECEQQLEKASQDYTNILAQNFGNKTDPISTDEMFQFFKEARQQAIESFSIKEDVREKFEAYDEYLDKLQNYMNDQEDKLSQINEGLAQNHNKQLAQKLLEKYQRELLSVEHSGIYSQKYGNVIKQCCIEYQNEAKGNQSEQVMIVLLKELFKISFDRLEQDQQEDNQNFNEDLEQMKQQIEIKKNDINEQFRLITIQKQQAQQEYEELIDDNEQKSLKIQNLLESNQDLQLQIKQKEDHLLSQEQLIKDKDEEIKKSKKKKGFLCFKKQFISIIKFNIKNESIITRYVKCRYK